MLIGGAFDAIALPFDSCIVPGGINGPVAIFITSDGQPLLNNVRDRATTQLVAGPLLAFIDTDPQMLSQLVRVSSDGTPDSTTSTATISPAQASAIIASSAATATADASDSAVTATAASSAPAASDTSAASSTSSAQSDLATASTPATPGSPNTFIGKSPDGSINVEGWSNL